MLKKGDEKGEGYMVRKIKDGYNRLLINGYMSLLSKINSYENNLN